jgi:hypothetical protein
MSSQPIEVLVQPPGPGILHSLGCSLGQALQLDLGGKALPSNIKTQLHVLNTNGSEACPGKDSNAL